MVNRPGSVRTPRLTRRLSLAREPSTWRFSVPVSRASQRSLAVVVIVVLEQGEDPTVCGRQWLGAAGIVGLGDLQDGLPGDFQPLQPVFHGGELLAEPGDLLAQTGCFLAADGLSFVDLGQELTPTHRFLAKTVVWGVAFGLRLAPRPHLPRGRRVLRPRTRSGLTGPLPIERTERGRTAPGPRRL